MGVARVGEGKDERADVRLVEQRQDVVEIDVEVVGRLVVAPAGVEADTVRGQALAGAGDGGDVATDVCLEVGQGAVCVRRVTLHGEIGAIELEHVAALDDALILRPQRVGDRDDVVVIACVVFV